MNQELVILTPTIPKCWVREMAGQDGPEAVAELEGQHQTALKLLPSA